MELRADQLFAQRAKESPNAIAVTMGAHSVSYAQLEAHANRLARYLRGRGVGRGSTVGVCLERSPTLVVALLGVMKSGGAYIPLDPGFPAERLQFMAEDAGLSAVLTDRELAAMFPADQQLMICLDECSNEIAAEPDATLDSVSGTDDLAYVLYTSGSTGTPKGVEIPHRALTNFLCAMREEPGCTERDTMLAVTTISFDISGLEIFLPLISGARVILASRLESSDGRLLKDLMRTARPTMMQATPVTWRMLIAAGWNGNARLRVLCGGESLPRDLSEELVSRSGELWNLYGPTETTIWSTVERVKVDGKAISIGRPIANTTVYVLDESLQPVPPGIAGELFIGGHGVARGYRNRQHLTAERFIESPFSSASGERLYRTGDLAAYLPDGRLVHLGRIDTQVKVRGFRIELGEVEARLAKHPAVDQVAVKASDDRQGMKQLVAYATVRQGRVTPQPSELRTFVRASLPEYMIPSHFIFLDALPVTANNKVDRKALPEPKIENALAETKVSAEPRGRVEVQLTALWRSVLGNESLGINDNFFDSGGHSLKAVELASFIEAIYGRQLPLATFFEAATVAEMAQLLARSDWKASWRSLVAIQPGGRALPLFAIPGVGGNVLMFARLARLLGTERPFYGLQAQGLDSADKPFTSVRKMAEHYVNEIRSVRQRGPYVIAGACTGGVIAYEMAQQLRSEGEAVVLMLLESWHPSSARRPTLRGLVTWPVRDVWSKLRDNDNRSRVARATWYAIANYRPETFPGALLNVIAAKRPVPSRTVDTRRSWEELAQGETRTAFSDATDSGQLFVSPHVEQLAELIARYAAEQLS